MTEIIHLVNYEAASGWFFSPDEIGFANYVELDYTNQVFPHAQNLIQVQSATNGVITQVHKLAGQNVNQTRLVSNGLITQIHNLEGQNVSQSQSASNGVIIITAQYINTVNVEAGNPIVAGQVLTATSPTTAEWI